MIIMIRERLISNLSQFEECSARWGIYCNKDVQGCDYAPTHDLSCADLLHEFCVYCVSYRKSWIDYVLAVQSSGCDIVALG